MNTVLALPSEALVGRLLRQARVAQQLTQRELARQADLSVKAIANLESGSGANLSSFLRVARVLGVAQAIIHALEQAVPGEDSPLRQLARAKGQATGRQRVRRGRANPPAGLR